MMPKYYAVPVINGDINHDFYPFCLEAIQNNDNLRHIKMADEFIPDATCTEITEDEFKTVKDAMGLINRHMILTASASTVAINTELPITITIYNWQDTIATDCNKTIIVIITGQDQTATQELTLVNGQIEFDFVSAVAGTYTIQATATWACDPGNLEVTVSE